MSSSKESFLVAAVRFFSAFFSALPLCVSLWVASIIGHVGYVLMVKKRRVVYANLRTIFAGEKTPAQIRAISRRVFVNLACSFMEVLCFPKITAYGFERFTE